MCDECDAIPVQYVAYFNKAGGKLWRPAQKQATAWAIDIRPPETPAARAFACEPHPAPAAPPSPKTGRDDVQNARKARNGTVG
jgi:hypothetical protein